MRELTQVSDRVWVAHSRVFATNSAVVTTGRDECVVVDPAVTPNEVAGLAAAITAKGWRVRAGLSTHPHWDHLLWSAGLGDAPRYGSPRAVAALTEPVRAAAWAAVEQTAPGHDFARFALLTALDAASGSELAAPPEASGLRVFEHRAHAPGHLAIVVDDVLLVGDMLSDVEPPLLDDGAETGTPPGDPVDDYRCGLRLLDELVHAHRIDVAVPGHGSVARTRAEISARIATDRTWLDQRQP